MAAAPDVAGLPWPEGDPGALKGAAANSRDVAAAVRQAGQRLSEVTPSGGDWKGQAASSFLGAVRDDGRDLEKAAGSFSSAAAALSKLATVLDDAQEDVKRWARKVKEAEERARKAEERASDAATKLEAAQAKTNPLLPLPAAFDPLVPFTAPAESTAYRTAQAEATEAKGDLTAIRTKAKDAADKAVKKVKQADQDAAGEIKATAGKAPMGGRKGRAGGRPSPSTGPSLLGVLTAIDHINSGAESLMRNIRSTVHGSRYLEATARRTVLKQAYKKAADFPRSGLTRRELLRRMRAHNLRTTTARGVEGRRAARAAKALRKNRAITSLGRRFPGATKVLTAGGKALGVGGIALSARDAYSDIRKGDVAGAVSNGVAIAGSAMMMSGVGAPVGAVLVAGSLVYEYRNEIGKAAKWTGKKIGEAADAAGEAADKVGDAAGKAADKVGDAAGKVGDVFGL
ncbi:MAG: hypothetical protein M3N28_06130 [Actinomycetota bacterium]|nr:hypothetical protein [Actinomycetota bacterium]